MTHFILSPLLFPVTSIQANYQVGVDRSFKLPFWEENTKIEEVFQVAGIKNQIKFDLKFSGSSHISHFLPVRMQKWFVICLQGHILLMSALTELMLLLILSF